ncbi:MAG: hypothetical protein KDD11_08635 [Acidobacteria bacterium]|nr:hypothetical protein [Acidobacteriota bacterium]
MAKDWQKNEITYLKRYAETKSLEELAERFDTTQDEVRHQLQGLGLHVKSSAPGGGMYDDPAVDQFAEAMKLLQAGEWAKAKEAFEPVVADSDLPDVAERARQMIRVAEHHLAAAAKIEDDFLAAVFEKNQGHFDAALKLCAKHKDEERFVYLEASIFALRKNLGDAVTALTRAVEMNPKNRVYAYHDPDFEAIRRKPELEGFFEVR